ncbi:MAG: PEP/pyruvate-binding domain-containing protein [Ktedonobacterales bacterium]
MTSTTSSTSPTSPLICTLRGDDDAPLSLVGGKGANLARLVRAGFPVPDGFVITTVAYYAFLTSAGISRAEGDPEQLRTQITAAPLPTDLSAQIVAAYEQLGAPAVAVRSSGTAEDLATASFAGQHDTFLDVSGAEALLAAVRACWASLWTLRAVAYRREHGWDNRDDGSNGNEPDHDLALAVVVQRMVPADTAGVAFTANPLTGERAETIISAVRGLGERLVSGQGAADEWVVRGEQVTCRQNTEGALDAERALTVARLVRRIADAFGTPQDVEWAFSGSDLFVLQARPATALPEPISWRSPTTGGWMRNFRLGEWLPEPVTPLFESWLLARIEEAEVAAEARDFGLQIRPPYHVIVNGWYFSSVQGGGIVPRSVAAALLRHPRRMAAFVLSVLRPELGERWLLIPHIDAWRTRLLPDYQRLVASWQDQVEAATPPELIRLVDQVATTAGEYLFSFSLIGGHAWKVERVLAQFYRKHLVAQVGRSYQELLRGLVPPSLLPPAHAVQSLDWVHPTAGDRADDPPTAGDDTPLGMAAATTSAAAAQAAEARHRRLQEERRAAERASRQALASRPRVLRRFETLLALAQRYAVVREEQAGWFTFGWPVMRRAVLRVGSDLSRRGVIARVDDIFFLTHREVTACIGTHTSPPRGYGGDSRDHRGEPPASVTARWQDWQRQRRLTPPLTLGKPVGAQLIAGAVEAMRIRTGPHGRIGSGAVGTEQILGMPASPGRASGPVRIVRGPEEFDRFQMGEVLVAQVTAPAWTPLFERAAAVITDGGSVAAHASLVAREYGIPAVVGTGDATARLHDGQRVTVDGSAGVIEVET